MILSFEKVTETNDAGYSFDFDAWKPEDDEEYSAILSEMNSGVIGTRKLCGRGEEVFDMVDLYRKVAVRGVKACIEDIQSYYWSLADAVDGRVDECYGDNPELCRLIRLTTGFKEKQ